MKEGPKLPSYLTNESTRKFDDEDSEHNDSRLSSRSKKLFTKDGKLGLGNGNEQANGNGSRNVRVNRFKNKNSVVSVDDPEQVEYIDRNKLKQSLKRINDSKSYSVLNGSPEKSMSLENESPRVISLNRLSRKTKIPTSSPQSKIKNNNLSSMSRNNSNSLSKGSIMGLKESMITNKQDSFVSDTSILRHTKKSHDMYLRNKFLREQIANKIDSSNASSIKNSRNNSLRNNSVSQNNSKFNSKNNSRESSLEKNANVKGIAKGIVKGLSRSNNSSVDVKGVNKLNQKSIVSRNNSMDKLDVKGVKVSHTQVQNVKGKQGQNANNKQGQNANIKQGQNANIKQGQNAKNYNQINSGKKPKFNIDISVDKANENIKIRKNELKKMVEKATDAKSLSRSPDNKNNDKNN